MARKRKKKALYEVISQSGSQSSIGRATQKDTEKADTNEAASSDTTDSSVQARWPRKPRILQFNAGRVEISMPYQLAVAVLLGIVLLVLVFFRLGQMSYLKNQEPSSDGASKTFEPDNSGSGEELPSLEPRRFEESGEDTTETASVDESAGDNVIVIQTLKDKMQLQPVKDYFNSLGIATRIIRINEWYYLVTEKKYGNPDQSGTAGYRAKQRIIRLGGGYKPPAGYKSFGDKPFRDAFGMKIGN